MVSEIAATFAAIADRPLDPRCRVAGRRRNVLRWRRHQKHVCCRRGVAAGAPDDLKDNNRRFGALLETVNGAPQVVIAAVEGYAMGGGFGLACVADVTIATSDARFAMSEVMIGVVAAAISPFVVQRIGLTAARRLGVSGARLDGTQAVAIGPGSCLRQGGCRARCSDPRGLQSSAQVCAGGGRGHQAADVERRRTGFDPGIARRGCERSSRPPFAARRAVKAPAHSSRSASPPGLRRLNDGGSGWLV